MGVRATSVPLARLCVGETGVDEALGKTDVRPRENVEGRAVLNLRGEHGGGLVSGFGVNAGGVLKLGENGRKDGLEIGGGGYAESRLRAEAGATRKTNASERVKQSCFHMRLSIGPSIHSGNRRTPARLTPRV